MSYTVKHFVLHGNFDLHLDCWLPCHDHHHLSSDWRTSKGIVRIEKETQSIKKPASAGFFYLVISISYNQ